MEKFLKKKTIFGIIFCSQNSDLNYELYYCDEHNCYVIKNCYYGHKHLSQKCKNIILPYHAQWKPFKHIIPLGSISKVYYQK